IDAEGAPPTIPFWLGEAPGRTIELSHEISRLRRELAVWAGEQASAGAGERDTSSCSPAPTAAAIAWLTQECNINDWAAVQMLNYVAAQQAALGVVPTDEQIVYERFFDDSGGMQLVIHS